MKVTRYEPQDQQYVKAHVDFYVDKWNLHLRDVRLIRGKNGNFWLTFPSKRVGADDSPQWIPYIDFDGEAKERFQDAAMKAIDAYVKEQTQRSEEDRAVTYDAPPF